MKRGFLIKKDNDRYGIVVHELSCGEPIQAFINGELIKGSIEGRRADNGSRFYENEYYLLGDNGKSYSLKNGIEVLFEE